MEIIKAALYGLVQGFTEFLPISSSGHLAILKNILGLDFFGDAILFMLILHLGSLGAVFIMYFKDIQNIIIGFITLIVKIFTGKFKYKNLTSEERFAILIFIATVPLVIGALIDKKIEVLADYTKLVGLFLIINAVVLFLSDRIPDGKLTEKTASPKNAVFIGICQLIAVAPGISRSGSTITGGLLSGFNRTFAVKFSFIMSIPAILGASVFKFIDFAGSSEPVNATMVFSCIVGLAFAFVSGIVAIVVLNMIARKKNFSIFGVYCLIAGILALIFG